MTEFTIQAAYDLTGDQPEAVDALSEGVRPRRPLPDASRRHGLRQDLHHGQRHPEGEEAHAGHRPQQDAGRAALQRVPRVPAGQRGGVLRQLLRLLPARGVRRGAGPLHREGLVHQRRDRPPAPRGHHVAVPAPRRRHRRQRELHLRPGLARGLPREDGPPAGRPDRRARRHAAQARRHPVRAQRLRARARQVPRARRLRGDLARRAGHRHPRAAVGRRGRADRQLRPGRAARSSRSPSTSPSTRRRTSSPTTRPSSARSSRSAARWRSAAPGSRRTARSSRRTGCASAPSTTWRCCARWATAAASRTTRASCWARQPGATPNCLLDYFPDDFLCFVDESHMSLPQIRAMSEGDKSRKQQLVDYGFRLPSALDNRPLRFDEFLEKVPQLIFVSATPGRSSSWPTASTSPSRSSAPRASSIPWSRCGPPRGRSTTS